MALTELQLPTKVDFYNRLRHAATEMDNVMTKWANLSEFIAMMDSSDLDAMGVATGQLRTDLVSFRILLDEMVSLYDGNSVTPTNPPNQVIDKIRSI